MRVLEDLFEELKDGRVLFHLLEVRARLRFTGQSTSFASLGGASDSPVESRKTNPTKEANRDCYHGAKGRRTRPWSAPNARGALQVLSGEDLSAYGRLTRGTMRIQLVANCNVAFKFLVRAHAATPPSPRALVRCI